MWSRFWGLMGRRSLPQGEALIIDPCSSVHTLFMRFPIDVVFVDKDGRVVKIAAGLKPFRAAVGKGSRWVIEMTSGAAGRAGLVVGELLVLTEAS
jgi:uncharacterized membrane protein (UPF0127 family)